MTVSLCMIVKNEEDSLSRCIESVKDLVDELVIVDTGSVDGTIEIAKSYGAHVFHYKWNDSFADARNFALSKAECDWILIMDADDELVQDDAEALKALIQDPESGDAYYMQTLCFTGSEPDLGSTVLNMNIRLLKNRCGYRFEGNIHEHPVGGLPGKPMLTADIRFYHYGYLQQSIDAKEKRKRNRALIERELKAHPEDPLLIFYLGNEYYAEKNYSRALQIFKQSLRVNNPQSSLSTKLIFQIIQCCQQLGQMDEALDYAEKILILFPNFTDAEILRASLLLRQSKIAETIRSLNRCIKMGDPPSMLGNMVGTGTFRPQMSLAEIYFNMGLYSKARYHCHKALTLGALTRHCFELMQHILEKKGTDNAAVLRKLMGYAKPGGSAAFLLLSDIYYDQGRFTDTLRLLDAAENSEDSGQNSELITYYKGRCCFNKKEFSAALGCFSVVNEGVLGEKAAFYSALCRYFETQQTEIPAAEKGHLKGKYREVLQCFWTLATGGQCERLAAGAAASQPYLAPVFGLLDTLIKSGRFDDFGKAVGLLKLIDSDKASLMLAKTYCRNGCFKAAYAEFINAIRQTGSIDEEGLEMMKRLLPLVTKPETAAKTV